MIVYDALFAFGTCITVPQRPHWCLMKSGCFGVSSLISSTEVLRFDVHPADSLYPSDDSEIVDDSKKNPLQFNCGWAF